MATSAPLISDVRDRLSVGGLEDVLMRRGWLTETTPGFRQKILGMGRQLAVKRGQRLFAFGDPPGGMYAVLSGGIGMEGCTNLHPLRLGHVVREGGWFGHGPALGNAARSIGSRALEDSRVLLVPLPPLTAWIHEDTEAARLVGELADRNSQLLTHIISDLLIPDAGQRTAAVLLRVSGALGGVKSSHPDGCLLTQSELGEMANVSRHHANRLLGQFAEQGWIAKSYNRLRLLDVAALSGFAYGED
ncbi:Crp/Fnr family transcriptional regulator [Sandaracinobacter neustonicus]|uniref:Crp/Fnr family transcriptional regulator n=1 Tax=Sandaracinobacter neustonicus TaxID=1715348 RepID=A0A501XLS1_9SPHN|nr:Crp/Fnr family transcriptional regulator [Sandaracinobacter neustonicus]TPE61588.1 Crp/Fnr family transcriptional regulator [Sandaracinobacter neustonicus]